MERLSKTFCFGILIYLLVVPSASGAEIDFSSGNGANALHGNGIMRNSKREHYVQKFQSRASNVAVTRWFAPSCMGDYFPSLTSYCASVSRARARDCPVGLNVFRLLDPVTGEELSRRGQAMPRDCVARPGGPGVVTVEVVMREFQELPLAGSGITFAPTSGEPVINLPFIVQSSADPQLLNTTILGTRVLIEATPTRFAWDYGDGSQPFVTTDPNNQYPDHSYEHTYTKRGPVTVSLTTTWRGRFQVAGGAWQTIPGTVTTNETSDSITVIELLPVNIN